MSVNIGFIDTTEERAEAFARRLKIIAKDKAVIFQIKSDRALAFDLGTIEEEDDWIDSSVMPNFDLILAHGNDHEVFDTRFGKGSQLVIWYGGDLGDWKEYDQLKIRGIECYKIYPAILGRNIPLEDQDLWEIIDYAKDPIHSENPACFNSPPDAGLLTMLSIATQCELLHHADKLSDWMKQPKGNRLSKSSVPTEIEEFKKAVAGIETRPERVKWKEVFVAGVCSMADITEEAERVSRSLKLDASWLGEFAKLISQLGKYVEAEKDPSIQFLTGLYNSLCALEKTEVET